MFSLTVPILRSALGMNRCVPSKLVLAEVLGNDDERAHLRSFQNSSLACVVFDYHHHHAPFMIPKRPFKERYSEYYYIQNLVVQCTT